MPGGHWGAAFAFEPGMALLTARLRPSVIAPQLPIHRGMGAVQRNSLLFLAIAATAIVALAFGSSGLVLGGCAWGVVLLAAVTWRVGRGDLIGGTEWLLVLFVVANAAWLASYLLRNIGVGAADASVALLAIAGTLSFAAVTAVIAGHRGRRRDLDSYLDSVVFVAALVGPLWLGLIEPLGASGPLLLEVAGWLLLLGVGGKYVLGGGRWNAPAVLLALGVIANVLVALGMRIAQLKTGSEVPASAPIYTAGFIIFTAAVVHPKMPAVFEPGHRVDGIPLAVRSWMMPPCVASPIGCVAYAYVTGATPPVLLASVLLVVMMAVVALRSYLMARAKVADWHVPITISVSTLFVGVAGISLALVGHDSQEARNRADRIAAVAPLIAQTDGALLRATDVTSPGADRAAEEGRSLLGDLRAVDTTEHPRLAELTAGYAAVADAALRLHDSGDREGAALVLRRDVEPAQEPLMREATIAAADAADHSAAVGRRTRLLSVLVLVITLIVVTMLLVRFAFAGRRQERTISERRDALTGLPNRTALERRLHHAEPGAEQAVVLLDLDDFKTINDASGHPLGDEVLKALAARLDASTRGAEMLARVDGDSFAVLVDGSATVEDAVGVVERLHAALAEPVHVAGSEHRLTGSVGVAVAGGERQLGAPAPDLLRDAELAMYEAKRVRGNSVELFAPEMHAAATDRIELAEDLRKAIEDDGLHLAYQPIIDLKTGHTLGYEALVRWIHPTRGFLSPADFIPLAEQTGLVVELGGWVLTEACRQLQEWRKDWAEPRYVSVNVAGEQLESGCLDAQVEHALGTSGLPSSALLLEVTESSLIANLDVGLEQMNEVRQRGVRFALDDFGTGYSSLSYLRRFPVSVLKVDKAFIDDVGEADGGALVAAIVNMAASLQLEVVAEGIEHDEQAVFLWRMGCALGQGYHFSRPLGAADVPGTAAVLWPVPDLRIVGRQGT